MSCNGWERGDIVLPSEERKPAREMLLDALREQVEAYRERCSTLRPPHDAPRGVKVTIKADVKWTSPKRGEAVYVSDGPLDVSLSADGKTLTWNVNKGNRTVEAAHASSLGQRVMRFLRRVDWKRGSGGYFTGNDEYNEEDTGAGGGANYVTHRFGAVGRKA